MVWIDFRHTLLTLLTAVSLWRSHVQANIPLYSTSVPEGKRGETIELLERALLNQLGLNEKPKKPMREVRIPQHMIDLYNQQTSDPEYMNMYFNKETALHANTARSFRAIGECSRPGLGRSSERVGRHVGHSILYENCRKQECPVQTALHSHLIITVISLI